jgi:hypothetical protein
LKHRPRKELNGVAGLLHSSCPHHPGRLLIELKRALDQPWFKMEAIRLTMELNTGELAIKKTWSVISRRRVQVETWMECGEEVLLNFFPSLPSLLPFLQSIKNLAGILEALRI